MTKGATFASLANRDFRRYFVGISAVHLGDWMLRIGQAWLVLELSGSGTLLGVTAAVQHVPTMLAAPVGGVIADRMDKRSLLVRTELAGCLLGAILAVTTLSGAVEVWMVLVFAFLHGCVSAVSQPAKKAYILDLVGHELTLNAVALNSVMFNVAKAIGPAIAGGLIVLVGVAASFAGNSALYLVMVIVLRRLPAARPGLHASDEVASRGLRSGLAYVVRRREVLVPLALMTVAGIVAYEWNVLFPLLAQITFDGDASTFGLMFSAMGVGAVAGGLFVAGRLQATLRNLHRVGLAFSVLLLAVAFAPTLTIVLVVMVPLGASSTAFRALATAYLQIATRPDMRGRAMGLLTIALVGTTPVGGPLIGWVSETWSPGVAFAIAGLSTAVAVAVSSVLLRRVVLQGSGEQPSGLVQPRTSGRATPGPDRGSG